MTGDSNQKSVEEARQRLRDAKRIIVKIGSRALAAQAHLPELVAAQFAELQKEGRSIVLISSGAVALGMERLGLSSRPNDLAGLQAAASAGQSVLMGRYDEAFQQHSLTSAQVLLTHGDLSNRKRVNNARLALASLLDAGAIPIINENDVVATEELKFSDNDELASMVAPLVDADALAFLSDVDGVLDEQGNRIPLLNSFDDFTDQGSSSKFGRGGMGSKISSAIKARRSGATVVIGNALGENTIRRIFAGEDLGTCLPGADDVLRARQHWIAYALKSRGTILVDDGAVRALTERQTSLLPVGVVGLRGEFRRGDAVTIRSLSGTAIGRGLTRLSTLEVARSAGCKGPELVANLGGEPDAVVIHRDDLVLAR